jgi:hypothetical protein
LHGNPEQMRRSLGDDGDGSAVSAMAGGKEEQEN